MEVAETFSHKSEQFIPFGLVRAADQDLYCAATRTKAHILELIYGHDCDDRVFMEQSTLNDLSTFVPSKGVPKNAASIFEKATTDEQHRLLVDWNIMTEELKVGIDRIALASVRWSPKINTAPSQRYLAHLTNFGGCEIRMKHTSKRSWSILVQNIAKDWMIECQTNMKQNCTTFATLINTIDSIRITAISWNNIIVSQYPEFLIITATGTMVVYNITGVDTDLNIEYQKQTDCKQVNALEWFTFSGRDNRHRSYVVACELNGVVRLFGVQYDTTGKIVDIIEKQRLFNETDGVHANGIQWEYCNQNNRFVVIFCKAMHVFVYLMSVEGSTIVSSCFHYVDNLTINGISRRNSMEYIVGTLNGHLECLKLSIQSNKEIKIESEAYKRPNSHTNYALYGIASSTNNAFLVVAFFAARPYDHLVLRDPAHIAVCHHLGGLRSLEMLLNNHTYSLSGMHDLAEAVRSAQLRSDKLFHSYLNTLPSEIVCTSEYLYSLKVRLIVTSARSTYLRLKNRIMDSSNLLGEYDILKKFIFAVRSYQALTYFNQLSDLKPFQILSAQCHRRSLREFVDMSIFEEYEIIKMQFHPAIELLLNETHTFDERLLEQCVYCNQPIEHGKEVCSENHELPRCCISMVQLPLMNERECTRCQIFALDDIEMLKLALPDDVQIVDDDDLICPLCDMPMARPHSIYYEHSD